MSRKRRKNRKPHQRQELARAKEAAATAARREYPVAGSLAVAEAPEEQPAEQHAPAPEPEPYRLPLDFGIEDFRSTWREAAPLMRAHAEELGLTEMPWPFKPAVNAVASLCEMNVAVWFTARERQEGRLVGYALYVISPWLISRDNLAASREWIYIDPSHRLGRGLLPLAFRFLSFCDNEVARRGVAMIEQRAMFGTEFDRMLVKAGYRPIENVYWKDTGQE